METQVFDADGTWVCPPGVTSVQAECVGGGSSGSARAQSPSNAGGAGGGGGACAKTVSIPVTPGVTYNVKVGLGGAAPPAGENRGNAGAASWFTTTGSFPTSTAEGCMAQGAAVCANVNTGAIGGLAGTSVGDVKTSGSNGGNGGTGVPGAAGGAAAAPLGGAGGPATTSTPQDGNPGTAPGGGGGGARSNISGGRPGGPGANGRVVLSWTSRISWS